MKLPGKLNNILLIEDNEGDIILTREAFKHVDIPKKIAAVTNVEEALEYLMKHGSHATAKRPDLVIMDMNMPSLSGLQLLKFLKDDKELRHIPVIMLSSSSSPMDISEAYQYYVNSYIVKSRDIFQFIVDLKITCSFWFQVANLYSTED